MCLKMSTAEVDSSANTVPVPEPFFVFSIGGESMCGVETDAGSCKKPSAVAEPIVLRFFSEVLVALFRTQQPAP